MCLKEVEEQQQPLKNRWYAENVGEPSEERGTSRDISTYRREASQLRNRVVLSNAQYARDGLGVLVASVCTENAFMKQKAGTCSFNRRTRDPNE